MKPSGEDMHSMLEGGEERAEPHEVFVDLGVLVVEGRVPGGAWAATRGYGEGPHCAGLGIAGSTGRHDCDPLTNTLCKRAENLQKHMQLLWQNNIPMCIEVLLCPDCPCGAQKSQSPEVSNIPSPTDLLLEQWMITMVSRKHLEQPHIPVRGLFQAVRSQLHFSQLAAWWSSSKGGSPAHISYRVTVPGEAFASQFQRPPLEHSFPMAIVTKNAAIKVSVRTLPRMECVPRVVCGVHSKGEKAESQCVSGSSVMMAKKSDGEAAGWCRKESITSPTDHLLGESLLDPPQSLDLFARRYQSPSRCASPCMEAPEHLMFSRVPAKPDVAVSRCLLPRWRESSPPSPPLTATPQRRLGRQGLARRRDTTGMSAERGVPWADATASSKPLPGLVDDRLQNPCNLPGKHHCYCAYDEDLDDLPKVVGHHRHRRIAESSYAHRSQALSKGLFVVKQDDHSNPVLAASSGKILPCSKTLSRTDDDHQLLADASKGGLTTRICDKELSYGAIRTAKRRSGVKMEERGGESSCKLNLELSRQEFDEVLAVLRDRNGPPGLSGGKKLSSPPECIPSQSTCDNTHVSSETGDILKPIVCSSHRSDLVYSVHTVTPTTSACQGIHKSSDKADLLMGAILRTNGNGAGVPAAKTDSASGHFPLSVLNEKLIKCKHKKDVSEFRTLRNICDNLKLKCDSKAELGSRQSESLNKSYSEGCVLVSTCDTQSGEECFPSRFGSCSIKNVAGDFVTAEQRNTGRNNVQNNNSTAKNSSGATGVATEETSDTNNVPKCLSASPVSDGAQILKSDFINKCNISNVPFMSSDCDQTIPSCEESAETTRSHNCNGVQGSEGCDTRNEAEKAISKKKRPSSPLIIPVQSYQLYEPVPNEVLSYREENDEDYLPDRPVPSALEKAKFRRSFDSAASMVFHSRTGLPLTSSPAPVRRGTSRFDFDSSLNSVSAIRSALFESITPTPDDTLSISSDDAESEGSARSPCSPGVGLSSQAVEPLWLYYPLSPCASLLGSFEESVLNGRLEPVSTVQGFTAELGASGSFCPKHLLLPVTVFFYTLGDNDKVSAPYLGHINLGKKGYHVPRSGTIQVTLFNPLGTVIKMFVVMYDLSDMPVNSQTFLRQRTLYMPASAATTSALPDNPQKWLRYLIHLRFSSSKSGRIHLHSDIRMIICRKSDMDTATAHDIDMSYELRSFTHGPANPKFSPRK